MIKKYFTILLFPLLFLASCKEAKDPIAPQVTYFMHEKDLKKLPSAFPPLSPIENETDWAREFIIGKKFAEELDLYQAMTAFKRANILISKYFKERKLELQYYILLTYYFGKRYQEVIYTFEHSDLQYVEDNFPVFGDLMTILYESYLAQGNEIKAEKILRMIKNYYPMQEETLSLSTALLTGNLTKIEMIAQQSESTPYLNDLLAEYHQEKKSIKTAKTLNAFLPGAGYLYIGQKRSAVTALLLNSLFVAATAYCFQQGNIAAGTILASFETGWYFGGIYGVAEETKLYNERLYETKVTPIMTEQKLFPAFHLKYAF